MLLQSLLKQLPPHWKEKLLPLAKEAFFQKLDRFLEQEYDSGKTIYPAKENIFRALEATDLNDVRVVILGQDPYHGPGQAIGFSFAVPNGLKRKPPSLKNIFKEITSDFRTVLPEQASDLTGWVEQGVLLLNTVLTVEAEKPLSHRNQGWEDFSRHVIAALNDREKPMVFLLWGSHAQKLKEWVDTTKHTVLETVHPSPLSAHRGFFGSKIFSKANTALKAMHEEPIAWDRISSEYRA